MSLCLVDIHGDIEGDYEVVSDLPLNPTNGDMIKAVFPNLNFKETKDFFERRIMNGGGIRCYIEWWNSPYRKENNNG